MIELDAEQQAARDWFEALRDRICTAFEAIEAEVADSRGGGSQNGGPIAIILRSWQLTKGHFWRLLGFVMMILLASIVVMLAVTAVAGILIFFIAGKPDPDSLASYLLLLVTAIVQAGVSTVFATLTARIYAQLAESDAPGIFT